MSVGVFVVFALGLALGVGLALYFGGSDSTDGQVAGESGKRLDDPNPVDASGELNGVSTDVPTDADGEVDVAALMDDRSDIIVEDRRPTTSEEGASTTEAARRPSDEHVGDGIREDSEVSGTHWLEGLNGSVEEKTFRLEETVTIGRQPRNDLQVREGDVSRVHCRLRPREGGIVMDVLDTVNGTRVNGAEVAPGQPIELTDEDVIEIGNLLFMYHHRAEFERDSLLDSMTGSTVTSDAATVTVDTSGWRQRIEDELELSNGNHRAAAQALGIDESDFERLVSKLEID